MSTSQKKKIENAVAFFAGEYKCVYSRWSMQMYTNYLPFLISGCRKMLAAMSGLTYAAMENGPFIFMITAA